MYNLSEIFSHAAKYLLTLEGAKTQAEICRDIGMKASSINGYINGTRGGNEENRRIIARSIGWRYTEFISLGMLIHEGHNPDEWECEGAKPDAPEFILWVKKGHNKEGSNVPCLITPPPELSDSEAKIELSRISKRVRPVDGAFSFIDQFDIDNFQPHIWGEADPVSTITYSHGFIEILGGAGNLAGWKANDSGVHLTIECGDIVLTNRGDENIREGQIYLIQIKKTAQKVFRRLAPRNGKILILSDNPSQFPAYEIDSEEIRVIGRALHISRRIS